MEISNNNNTQQLQKQRGRPKSKIVEDVPKEPKKKGRPPLPLELKKVKDNSYFKNYYHSSNLSEVIQCEICNSNITRQKLKRHQLSLYCKGIANNKNIDNISNHNDEPNIISQLNVDED